MMQAGIEAIGASHNLLQTTTRSSASGWHTAAAQKELSRDGAGFRTALPAGVWMTRRSIDGILLATPVSLPALGDLWR